ncbi:hypothetical protein BRARA_I00700 [Brassica rapa]|uniref:Major facilitator superfamily (MFS) profile domain-containing protein n=1 Tax=Brassica campestris TaxID=3711 RepID=A0A397XRM7_BRACM|nr:hypothetical protein BRARA_I00700 [Brassica rapa]
MERKSLEVESMDHQKLSSAVYDGSVTAVDSVKEDVQETKVVYRGWKVMPYIIGNETFEKLGIIGTLSNLLVYLTSVFNMKSVTAATIITAFAGTVNFGTFVAAFLCDTYFGRYKTLTVAGSLAILLTAAVPQLHPAPCGTASSCIGPSGGQIAFLLMGLGILVVGAGGIRPCNLAFGADQFNPKSGSGKRGIDSFFNWYFFTFTFAQILSLTVVVYVQSNVSWTIGLTIPVVLMFLASVIFFAGAKLYVKIEASGSPLASIAHVITAAIKKHRMTQNSAGGNWLAEDLNKGRLDYFYFLLAGILAVNFAYFLVMARWYRYKGSDDEETSYETSGDIIKEQDKNKV